MRLIVKARGRTLDLEWSRDQDDDGEPGRESATDSLTERADPNPPSEVSVPMGFQPIYYEEDHNRA